MGIAQGKEKPIFYLRYAFKMTSRFRKNQNILFQNIFGVVKKVSCSFDYFFLIKVMSLKILIVIKDINQYFFVASLYK